MGGEVGVRSESRPGLDLLGARRMSMRCRSSRRAEPIGLGRKILIVDDIPAARESLAMKLNLFGYDTVPSGGVDEALEQLAKDPASIWCLADELMPVRGGLDLLKALRTDARYHSPALHFAVPVRRRA